MKINIAKNSVCIIALLLALAQTATMSAQNISLELAGELVLEADRFVGADEKGGIYYIREQVFYRQVNGKTFAFSSPEYGDLTQAVIYNPFKILLFYKEFNTVVILDNNLNPLSSPIDLTPESSLYNVTHVGISSENNIWLFADDNKLHLLNYQNRSELVESQPLTFYDENFKAVQLCSTFKKVWLLSENTIYEFNEYGNFLEQEAAQGAKKLLPLARSQGRLYAEKLELHLDEQVRVFDLDLPAEPFELHLTSSVLYLYDGKLLRSYRYAL